MTDKLIQILMLKFGLKFQILKCHFLQSFVFEAFLEVESVKLFEPDLCNHHEVEPGNVKFFKYYRCSNGILRHSC